MAKRTPLPHHMQKRWDERQAKIDEEAEGTKRTKELTIRRLTQRLEDKNREIQKLKEEATHSAERYESLYNLFKKGTEGKRLLEQELDELGAKLAYLSLDNRKLQEENVNALDAESRVAAAEAKIESLELSVQLLRAQNQEERKAREIFIDVVIQNMGFYSEVYGVNFEKPTLQELQLQLYAYHRMMTKYLNDIHNNREPQYTLVQAVYLDPDKPDFALKKRFYDKDAVYVYAQYMGYEVDSIRTITLNKGDFS